MTRAGCLLFGFILGFLTQCTRTVPVDPVVVQRGSYAYVKVGEVFHVAAVNRIALDQALTELGCFKTAQCLVSRNAELFIVEVHLK